MQFPLLLGHDWLNVANEGPLATGDGLIQTVGQATSRAQLIVDGERAMIKGGR